MKSLTILIACVLLLAPLSQTNAAGGVAPGTIVLTADMVQDAIDIEAAIIQATGGGARPGIVILDGRGGPFEYAPQAEDVDINIFVSDLTLRGLYQARLSGGAITLDGMELHNITIEGLRMECPQDCITSTDGLHQNVIVRNNQLKAGNFGVDVGWTDGWLIRDNRITAGGDAIHLTSTSGIKVHKNQAQGHIAVRLESTNDCQISNNDLSAEWQGVLLTGPAMANQVIANSISGVQASGITLEWETLKNKVHANRVHCAADYPECLVVEDLGTDNHIKGNR
jgi:nitrous oxidase accessory protein NosD